MPEIDQRLSDRPAGAGQHLPPKLDQPPLAAGLDKIDAPWGAWLEIRPLGLARSRFIPVVARRRRSERLGPPVVECEAGRGERPRAPHAAAGGIKFVGHGGLLDRPSGHTPAGELSRERARAVIASVSAPRPRLPVPRQEPLDCAPRTRTSISSTAWVAAASLSASRARSTTLVLGRWFGSKNG